MAKQLVETTEIPLIVSMVDKYRTLCSRTTERDSIRTSFMPSSLRPMVLDMVCTGNQGRSPVAELIAANYLREIGADQLYGAISSGTSVTAIKQGNVDQAFRMKIIGIARDRGLYAPDELQQYDRALAEGDDVTIKALHQKAEMIFVEEERRYRAEVLPELRIEGTLKEEQEQTVPRNDTLAVFSMAGINNGAVQKIYDGHPHRPLIEVLSTYAHNDPKAQIPNAFGLPREKYVEAVQTLQRDVPKAIDRLLSS